MALKRERSFPSTVFGPLDRAPFDRLASSRFDESLELLMGFSLAGHDGL
jgi:hypothetical protein